jgi:hypothetical protein
MDIASIVQAAQVISDDHGLPVVMLPLSLWQELLKQINVKAPQHERLKAILKSWRSEPDDMPPEWWDEFDADLRANRTVFRDRDLGLLDVDRGGLTL